MILSAESETICSASCAARELASSMAWVRPL